MNRKGRLALVCSVGALVGAAGVNAAGAAHTVSADGPGYTVSHTTQDLRLRGGTIVLAPPAAGYTPPVTSEAIDNEFRATSLYAHAANTIAPDTFTYGLLTDSEYGPVNEYGVVVPSLVNTPVWVVGYASIPDEVGPFGTRSTPPGGAALSKASLYTFFSADTGKELITINDSVK